MQRYGNTISRLLLGFVFAFFGMNGFLHFIPTPPMQGDVATFFSGMAATGYFFPFLAGVQVVSGVLLLTGAYVPLALVMLAPVIVNILLVHIFLDPKGLPVAFVVVALEAYLSFFAKPYREPIRQLFRP